VNVVIAPGAPDDLDAVVALDDDACRLYADAGLAVALPEDHPFTIAERLEWRRSLELGWTFVARDDAGTPVGFAACELVDGAPYLDQLSVRVTSMRRGVGRALLRRAVEWARAHGDELWLTTYAHLPWNRPFYEREGFVVEPACGPDLAARLADQRRCLPAPEQRLAMRKPLGALAAVAGLRGVVLGDGDRARLAAFCAATSDFFELIEGQPGGDAQAAELLAPLEPPYDDGVRTVWGFERDGRLVAVAELLGGYPTERDWYIGLLLLHPDERARGLGRALVAAVRRWLAERDGDVVRVVVQEQNPRARAFWEREGFTLEREVVKRTGAREGKVAVLARAIAEVSS
jgi:GNAT superfamily N-acetyltransferase